MEGTPWRPFLYGASNGNLNPHLVLRFAADELVQIALLAYVGRWFACNLRRFLAPVVRSTKKGHRMMPFLCGASNGNRTRIASLGSWSFTIRLYPRMHILYTIPSDLSRGYSEKFPMDLRLSPTNNFTLHAHLPRFDIF